MTAAHDWFTFGDLEKALAFVIQQKEIDVVNMSFGIGTFDLNSPAGGPSAAMVSGEARFDPYGTLNEMIRVAQATGTVFVTGAGNQDWFCPETGCWPAVSNDAFVVAATDESDRVWEQSSRLMTVDVAAPGVNITASQPTPGAPAVCISGTSAAASHVSGLIALVQAYGRTLDPEYAMSGQPRVVDVETLIRNTADPAFNSSGYATPEEAGAGRIDALAAMTGMVAQSRRPVLDRCFAKNTGYHDPITPYMAFSADATAIFLVREDGASGRHTLEIRDPEVCDIGAPPWDEIVLPFVPTSIVYDHLESRLIFTATDGRLYMVRHEGQTLGLILSVDIRSSPTCIPSRVTLDPVGRFALVSEDCGSSRQFRVHRLDPGNLVYQATINPNVPCQHPVFFEHENPPRILLKAQDSARVLQYRLKTEDVSGVPTASVETLGDFYLESSAECASLATGGRGEVVYCRSNVPGRVGAWRFEKATEEYDYLGWFDVGNMGPGYVLVSGGAGEIVYLVSFDGIDEIVALATLGEDFGDNGVLWRIRPNPSSPPATWGQPQVAVSRNGRGLAVLDEFDWNCDFEAGVCRDSHQVWVKR